jgi:hypothetical protein
VERVLRILTIATAVLFAAALYAEFHGQLAPESLQYQLDYPDALRNGLNPLYLGAKVAWLAGACLGGIGALLILFSRRRGFLPMLLSAPLIGVGALLQAPQSNYPSLEPTGVFILWCAAAASWGALVALSGASEIRLLSEPEHESNQRLERP